MIEGDEAAANTLPNGWLNLKLVRGLESQRNRILYAVHLYTINVNDDDKFGKTCSNSSSKHRGVTMIESDASLSLSWLLLGTIFSRRFNYNR